jgi:tyrosyl-tRNA synthetase
MWRYLELLSFRPMSEIERWKRDVEGGRNPRDIKVQLGQEIVERFHSKDAAEQALRGFEARFRAGALPDEMPEVSLYSGAEGMPIPQALKQAGLAASTSEALRAIEQGGVKVNGERVSDKAIRLLPGSTVVLQLGKRKFARVSLIAN